MNSRRCVLVALQGELTGLMLKLKDLISENEELMNAVRESLVGGTGAPSLPPPRRSLPESQVTSCVADNLALKNLTCVV